MRPKEAGMVSDARMDDADVDKRIADAMRAYFGLKHETALLKKKLEGTRKETGQTIDFFYDPRQNVSCAAELVRLHHGRRDMARHLQFADVLASGDRRALSDRLD